MQKKVIEVFSNTCFSIPEYQRDYAWEKENLDDLWEDLLEAREIKSDEMGHFLGTIVVAKNPKNLSVYDIIDGQQRATTLFMLRYALNFKTDNPNYNLNHFRNDEGHLRLQVIDENKDFFKQILVQAENKQINSSLKSKASTSGQKRLYEVFKAIWDYVGDLSPEEAKEYLAVLNNMALMWLEEKDSGRAIRMFQTVNDRGVPLLILDKLKALLILYSNKYCEGKLDEAINDRFGEIFRTAEEIRKHRLSSSLGDKDFVKEAETRIFHYHALGQKEIGNYKYGADESYRVLKDLLKNKVKQKKDFEKLRQWLDEYSQDLLGFFKAFYGVMQRTETDIEAFKLLYVLKINPYFYSSLVRMEMNDLLDNEILILFAQAEICFYGLGSTNDASAYKLYEVANDKESFKKKVKELARKCARGGHKTLQEALNNTCLKAADWGKYFHYVFLTYRCSDMDFKAFENLIKETKTYKQEIEHIIPQNAPENGSLEQYGFKDGNEFNDLKDSFGNLLVLESSLNSKARDGGPATKQGIYKESQVFYCKKFAKREDFLSFGKEQIEKENEEYKRWIKEEFFKDFL